VTVLTKTVDGKVLRTAGKAELVLKVFKQRLESLQLDIEHLSTGSAHQVDVGAMMNGGIYYSISAQVGPGSQPLFY
jgi:hypothetical protein